MDERNEDQGHEHPPGKAFTRRPNGSKSPKGFDSSLLKSIQSTSIYYCNSLVGLRGQSSTSSMFHVFFSHMLRMEGTPNILATLTLLPFHPTPEEGNGSPPLPFSHHPPEPVSGSAPGMRTRLRAAKLHLARRATSGCARWANATGGSISRPPASGSGQVVGPVRWSALGGPWWLNWDAERNWEQKWRSSCCFGLGKVSDQSIGKESTRVSVLFGWPPIRPSKRKKIRSLDVGSI